jgi:hypothetical protein
MVKTADIFRRIFRKRRAKWDIDHPQFAGADSARNLNEKLRTYICVVKQEEENEFVTMDLIVQKMATHDEVVREVWDEIQCRYEQEVELQRHELTPDELREGKQKDILKELADLDLATQLKGSSAFTPDTKAEGEGVSDNPILNRADKELKRKIGILPSPRIAKVGNHTVFNPADYDPSLREGNPSQQIASMAELQEEMEKAISKLIPSDNYVIAEKVKKDYDKYLARREREAYETE